MFGVWPKPDAKISGRDRGEPSGKGDHGTMLGFTDQQASVFDDLEDFANDASAGIESFG